MRYRITSAFLFAACIVASGANAGQQSLADAITADPESFTAQIEAQLRRSADASQAAAMRAVGPDLTDSHEWRVHPRHRGILVAIPVKRDLLARDKYAGEAAIRDVVERLIRQRDLSGRIEVVFIEPSALDCPVRSLRTCACVVTEHAVSPVCDCR